MYIGKKIIKYALGFCARNTPIRFNRFGYPNKILQSAPWLQFNYQGILPSYVKSILHLPDRANRIIKTPKSILINDINPWGWVKEWKPRSRYIVTLKSARICQNTVISPDNIILWDFSFVWNLDPQDHPLLAYPILPAQRFLPGRSLFLGVASYDNYFHWIFDLLQKFKVMEDAHIDIFDYDYYLVNSQKFEFQRKSLILLGIPKHKIIETSRSRNLIAESLTIPSLADQSGLFETEDVQWLRSRLMAPVSFIETKSKDNIKKRLFISRKKTAGRNITNYNEIKNVLQKYKFDIIELEGLELEQQIKIFNNAEVIVSAHGAALTNLLFCSPSTKVIELVNPHYAHQMYYYLSMILDLDYYYIICDSTKSETPMYDDISVNPLVLESKLNDWFQ